MSDAEREPDLTPEEMLAFEKGVREFNDGYFFECHDTLEEVWTGVRGSSRDFLQGLIQVSVAFYHVSRGNLAGAESMLGRALGRFAKYGNRYWGFELGSHRQELAAWLARIRSGDGGSQDLPSMPKWSFDRLSSDGDLPAAET